MGSGPILQSVLKYVRCLSPLLLLLFFVSCNSELATLSPIRNTPLHLETSNAGAFTHMMIYATRTDGSFAFGRMFTSAPVIDMEVPIGDYRFYGMTFNGVTSELCSQGSSYLSGLSNRVTLNFDEVTCGDSIFLGTDPSLNLGVLPSVIFPFTGVELCDSVANITTGTDECTDQVDAAARKHSRGHAASMKVTLMAFEKSRGQTTASSGITIGCQVTLTPAASLRGLLQTSIGNFYPSGDGSSTPFLIRAEFYPDDANCSSGTPHVVDLQNGLVVNNSAAKLTVDGGGRKLYVKVGPEEICKGDNLLTTFAGGVGGIPSPKLICSEEQFYNIFPNTSDPSNYSDRAMWAYKLMINIDLSDNPTIGNGFNPEWESCAGAGANFMPIGFSWDGTVCSDEYITNVHFDGNGFNIKGLKIKSSFNPSGLYGRIDYGGGPDNEIKRLTLIDPEISGQAYLGTLVGYSSRTKFTDINIQNPIIYSPLSNFVGGVVGFSEADTFQSVTVSNLFINAQNQVGGLIGQSTILGGVTTNIFDSYVDGRITAFDYAGGLVGNNNAGGAGTNSLVKRSRFTGDLRSRLYAGGLMGQATTTRIEHSYALTNFTNIQTNNVRLGGIVGNMLSNTGGQPSGFYSSYGSGVLVHACNANPITNCAMGTLVGSHDGTFTVANFDTSVYRVADALSTTLIGLRGIAQPTASFMSANPGWTSPGPVDMMYLFPPTIWKFSDTHKPKLVGEPQ